MLVALANNHFVHTALAVELESVVIDTTGEVAFVEGDGVAAFGIVGGLFMYSSSYHVGDKEVCIATVGQ